MSIIRFIGDLHFGKSPSHSTKDSAQRFKDTLSHNLMDLQEDNPAEYVVQVGDLFDKFEVPSTDFVRAFQLPQSCSNLALLGGNHDWSHDTTKKSALENLQDVEFYNNPLISLAKKHCYTVNHCQDTEVWMVPYHPTQADFESALAAVEVDASKCDPKNPKILVLHCNYEGREDSSEIENNLTSKNADLLLKKFDFILSGHEHNSSVYKLGRLIMTGSFMPFSYDEVAYDKYVWEFDTDTGEMASKRVWNSNDHAYITYKDFMAITGTLYKFIELDGFIKPEEVLPLVRHIQHILRETNVFSIKDSTELSEGLAGEKLSLKDGDSKLSWEKQMEVGLSPEEVDVFKDLLIKVQSGEGSE